MKATVPEAENAITDVAQRHGLSREAVLAMLNRGTSQQVDRQFAQIATLRAAFEAAGSNPAGGTI
ncbi:hypothetical protein [Mycobacterium sp.]|uniref:hypothetical protein n=1 Tax=Mycobacterium sp. TaxID=1785 RepID=UPI003F9903A6